MSYESGIASASDAALAFFRAYEAHDIDTMLSLCTSTAQLRHVPMERLETGSVRWDLKAPKPVHCAWSKR
jgi:hypothetical protein